jgi:glycosyltransferase involved in cell wall biosynthesis
LTFGPRAVPGPVAAAPMSAPLLLDLTHTSHTRARTGVQRVARSLWRALGDRALPICRDPYLRAWRLLEPWELANLAAEGPAARRGARWTFRARWRSRFRRWAAAGADGAGIRVPGGAAGLIAPEIFSSEVAAALEPLGPSVAGPRAAVFHDAIALRLPELTPARTVARFPAYLQELLVFDGIAAISEDSRRSLLEYWAWLGVADPPPVATIPLGIDPPVAPDGAGEGERAAPTVLCVGSIEGRKNHAALLEACETLWARGLRFELRLIGLAQEQTARAAIGRLAELQRLGRPLRYDGPVPEAELAAAFRACAFTVYPSLQEGFGLPILESLAHGRACVCSGAGALGEAARGGGCLVLGGVDAPELAAGIERLLADPLLRARLEAEARGRRFRTWADYARDLQAWLADLPRRKPLIGV